MFSRSGTVMKVTEFAAGRGHRPGHELGLSQRRPMDQEDRHDQRHRWNSSLRRFCLRGCGLAARLRQCRQCPRLHPRAAFRLYSRRLSALFQRNPERFGDRRMYAQKPRKSEPGLQGRIPEIGRPSGQVCQEYEGFANAAVPQIEHICPATETQSSLSRVGQARRSWVACRGRGR